MLPLRRLCAVIIGLVFAFSSVFKLMDPVGTGLIVESYLQFLHMDFLRPAAKVIGELVSLTEATLCVALITGVWQKITAIVTMSMLAFFTIISIFLAIFKPDMSCGCFGKVLELTHNQTLAKNLVLDALAAFSFFPLGKLGINRKDRFVSFGIAEAAIVAFAVYFLVKVPILDSTEFSPSHTIVCENREGFEGFEYPTLTLWNAYGEYCPEMLTEGKVAVISVYKPEKLDESDRNEIAGFAQDAINSGWTPVILVAGDMEIPGMDVYSADNRKLMTINRSNGGVTFLDDGYIIRKYARCDYPDFETLEEMYGNEPVEMYVDYYTKQSLSLQAFCLVILAIMFFV